MGAGAEHVVGRNPRDDLLRRARVELVDQRRHVQALVVGGGLLVELEPDDAEPRVPGLAVDADPEAAQVASHPVEVLGGDEELVGHIVVVARTSVAWTVVRDPVGPPVAVPGALVVGVVVWMVVRHGRLPSTVVVHRSEPRRSVLIPPARRIFSPREGGGQRVRFPWRPARHDGTRGTVHRLVP